MNDLNPIEGALVRAINSPLMDFFRQPDPKVMCPALGMVQGEAVDPSAEIIEQRKPSSKTFRLGPDEFKLIISMGLVHYDNNGTMEEIDLRIQDVGGKKMVTKAPYKIEIFTNRVGYHLKKPCGDHFTIELAAIGGVPVNNAKLRSRVSGCQVFWEGLAKDISMKVLLFPEKPEMFTQILSSSAPRTFTWKITRNGKFEFKSFGGDMNQDSLEILVEKQDIDAQSYFYKEIWTGRVSRKEKRTRIKSWYHDPVYPIVKSRRPLYPAVIDPTSTANITADADAGYGRITGTFKRWITTKTFCRFGFNTSSGQEYYYYPGFRFEKVPIPSGTTITTAKLKIIVKSVLGTNTSNIFGEKVANASAFSSSNMPNQITKTTNSTSWSIAAGTVSKTVKAQVSSIIGVGGWAKSNAMAFAVLSANKGSHHHANIDNKRQGNPPKLIITYTAAGGLNPARRGDMNFMGI